MEAVSLDQARCKLGALVSYMRAIDPDFLGSAPKDAEGRGVVVPVLGNDSIHYASRLVHRMGGEALVVAFMPSEDRQVTLTSARVNVSEVHANDDDCHVPVGRSCTVADLLKILGPGASMTLRMAGDEMLIDEVEEREVDGDDLISA